jgi:GntR family uxuAB operon transcriptional repressor
MDLSDQPKLAPIAASRRYLAVAQQVMTAIARGEFSVGERLPAERELALQAGVSRPTAREALLVLELAGAIESRPGDGAYVTKPGLRRMSDGRSSIDAPPRELLEARGLIEPQVAAHIARHGIDADQMRGLRENVANNAAIVSDPGCVTEFVERGLEFHLLLAKATRNSILSEVTFQLVDNERHPLWKLVNEQIMRDINLRKAHIEEHIQVLDAIEEGRSEAAEKCMQQHLFDLQAQIFS